jgi:hypothetical protein
MTQRETTTWPAKIRAAAQTGHHHAEPQGRLAGAAVAGGGGRAAERGRGDPPGPVPGRLYRTIPTIGWLFLLQVIAAFGLGLAVLAIPGGRLVLAGRLAAAAGGGFALATLGGYLLTVWIGLFGFRRSARPRASSSTWPRSRSWPRSR